MSGKLLSRFSRIKGRAVRVSRMKLLIRRLLLVCTFAFVPSLSGFGAEVKLYPRVFSPLDEVTGRAFPIINTFEVYPKSSPQYGAFQYCQAAKDKNASCESESMAYFFDLSSSDRTSDAFDMLNRCISLSFGKRVLKGLIQITSEGISCEAVGDEIVMAQVAACYQRSTGAFCRFATLCFEGDRAQGRCTRDYPAEELYVARNVGT
jgi:hypothetical protein